MMLEGFTEFNYLSAQKVRAYRAIMRVFYDQYLLQRSTIPPEEVRDALLEQGFVGYDLDQTLIDLGALAEWKNLDFRRDQGRVRTLQEYSRRRNLYFATPRGLSIERFLEEGLDSREDEVLSPVGDLSRLEEHLAAVSSMLQNGGSTEEIEQLWNDAHQKFVRLSSEVRQLASNLERRLTLEERDNFLEFKDVVRGFVERLARELSGAGRRVRDWFASFEHVEVLARTVAQERSGRLTVSGGSLSSSAAASRFKQEFAAMQGWFARDANAGDGLEYAIVALRASVTRVLAFVDALHRTRELGLGRAGFFSGLAQELQDGEDVLEVRARLAQALRLNAPLHAIGDAPLEVGRVWHESLESVELFAVQKGRVAARDTAQVRTVSPEARAAALAAQDAFRARQARLLALFRAAGGTLRLNGLELADIESLHDLVGYLGRASGGRQGGGMVAGPEGHVLEVTLESDPVVVHGPDWVLHFERGASLQLLEGV
jgi:uncharacterized protein (TIGR02677 family)